jgi:hypothetical protein
LVTGTKKILDGSGYGRHGTLGGSGGLATWEQEATVGSYLDFTAANQYTVHDPIGYVTGRPLTMMAWVNKSTYWQSSYGYIFNKAFNGLKYGITFYFDYAPSNVNWLTLYIATSGTDIWNRTLNNWSDNIGADSWHHVCVIWTGVVAQNQIGYWIDGVQWGAYDVNTPTGTLFTGGNYMSIGGRGDDTADRTLDGRIANVMYYDRIVRPNEIRHHASDPHALYRQQQVVSVAVPSAPRWPFGMQGGTSILTGGLT